MEVEVEVETVKARERRKARGFSVFFLSGLRGYIGRQAGM